MNRAMATASAGAIALVVGLIATFAGTLLLVFAGMALGGTRQGWWEWLALAVLGGIFLVTAFVSFREIREKLTS